MGISKGKVNTVLWTRLRICSEKEEETLPANSCLKLGLHKQIHLFWKEFKNNICVCWLKNHFPLCPSYTFLGIMTSGPQPWPPSFLSLQKLAPGLDRSLDERWPRRFLCLCPWIWCGRGEWYRSRSTLLSPRRWSWGLLWDLEQIDQQELQPILNHVHFLRVLLQRHLMHEIIREGLGCCSSHLHPLPFRSVGPNWFVDSGPGWRAAVRRWLAWWCSLPLYVCICRCVSVSVGLCVGRWGWWCSQTGGFFEIFWIWSI